MNLGKMSKVSYSDKESLEPGSHLRVAVMENTPDSDYVKKLKTKEYNDCKFTFILHSNFSKMPLTHNGRQGGIIMHHCHRCCCQGVIYHLGSPLHSRTILCF